MKGLGSFGYFIFLFFFLRFRCTHSTMLASAFFRKITSWKTTKYILGERHCFCLEDRGFSRSWRGSSLDGHLRLGLLAFIYQALLIPSGYGYGIPRFIQAAFLLPSSFVLKIIYTRLTRARNSQHVLGGSGATFGDLLRVDVVHCNMLWRRLFI